MFALSRLKANEGGAMQGEGAAGGKRKLGE
jgi:hypothetical protein